MKKKLISIVKLLGITFDEVILDISLEDISFDSIEWRREEDKIILHKFVDDEFDYEFNYDDLPNKIKKDVYLFFTRNFLN